MTLRGGREFQGTFGLAARGGHRRRRQGGLTFGGHLGGRRGCVGTFGLTSGGHHGRFGLAHGGHFGLGRGLDGSGHGGRGGRAGPVLASVSSANKNMGL